MAAPANQPTGKKDQRTPPGPAGLALLKQLAHLQSDPLAFFHEAARQYGDLVYFKAGTLPVFFLNSPETIQHVLQDNNRNYTKNTIQYKALARVTGQGLLTSDGELWLRQRRLAQPAFHRQVLQTFDASISQSTQEMITTWQPLAGSRTGLDIDQAMMRLALEILGKALLSIDLSAQAPALTGAVLTALDHIMYRARNVLVLPDFFPTPRNRRFKTAMQTLDQAVYQIIAQHQRARPEIPDLLDLLVKSPAEDESNQMGMEQLRNEVITILIAGHETVASALTWCFYLLAKNPDVQRAMTGEIASILGNRPPAVSDLEGLSLVRGVFDEALRLYPPAWVITRRATLADEIGGYHVPPGALMVICTATIHRHPAYWTQPDSFEPGRFTPENSAGRPRYAYLPFGGGSRQCIGNYLALMEGPLILAAVLQRYQLNLLPGYQAIPEALVTLRPRHGLPVTIANAVVR